MTTPNLHNAKPASRYAEPTAFDAFYKQWRGKTPANAVRLAIADHQAQAGGSGAGIGDFVSALRRAERLVEGAPALATALLAVLPLAEAYLKAAPTHPDNGKLADARDALDALRGDL